MSEENNKTDADKLMDDIRAAAAGQTDGQTQNADQSQMDQEEGAAFDSDADAAIHSIVGEIDNDAEADDPQAPSMEQQLAESNGQVLKLHAELENVRKRLRRESEDMVRFASLPLIADLLQVFDNLKRAIEAASTTEGSTGLVEGVQMVAKQFEDTLGKFHCKPIPAQGELFDPNFHEAISQMPSDDVESGHVMIEATQGFQLHDRVVRPSQVVVSTGKAG